MSTVTAGVGAPARTLAAVALVPVPAAAVEDGATFGAHPTAAEVERLHRREALLHHLALERSRRRRRTA